MRKHSAFKLLLLFFVASFSSAMADDATAVDEKEQLIADFERAKAYTLEYMEAMPEDGYSFQPTDDIRTFAQQMLHLAGANYFFTANSAGVENPMEGMEFEKDEEFQSKASAMKAVSDSYDFVIATLKGMSEEQLNEEFSLFGRFKLTRAQGFAKAFEHGTHHRGQTTIYLRLKGVTPPQEKLI
ncbi:DinB family protein [Marinilongibacter aquaticus]|uniref:DinB family protein n=1 Tax=Marinilongibacter aquaticus TaxID=2975157 RepID=UPI0021BD90A7|nr:DinB family protein [Marinilongibacter aquaticus]UBM60364.1 DinB family protein [Marinilongibacter aquaticus]